MTEQEIMQGLIGESGFAPIPITVSIAHFMGAWDDSNYHCVFVGN